MEKSIKSLVMLSFIFVSMLFANSSYAQGKPQGKPATSEEMATREVSRMKTDLNLSMDQEASVKAIVLKYEEQKKTLRKSSKEDREAGRTKMQELEKQKDAELKGVLNTEQYQKWTAKKTEMQNRDGGNHGGSKGEK